MKKWMRGLTVILATMFLIGMLSSSVTAAATSAYLVKDDSGTVYYYDAEELEDSFINNQLESGDDTLYLAFIETFKENGFYAFQNSNGEYIDYKDVESAFLDDPDNFNLGEYLVSDEAERVTDMPATVTKVTVENGELVEKVMETETGNVEPTIPEVIDIY
ncbi:MAG: hypothetical protein H0Z32_15785 [Bacillaceae bacterium]|nr:hypothetical protein [Bacillaceae bacterium]